MARIEMKLHPERIDNAVERGFDNAVEHGIRKIKSESPVGRSGRMQKSVRAQEIEPLKVTPVFKLGRHLKHAYVQDAGWMTRGGRRVTFRHGGGFRRRGLERFADTIFAECRRAFRSSR